MSVITLICRIYVSMEPISKHTVPVPVQKGVPGDDYYQHSGISRGGHSTKIHAVVDGLDYPFVLELSDGQVNDKVKYGTIIQ